jgi:hypothetical protein
LRRSFEQNIGQIGASSSSGSGSPVRDAHLSAASGPLDELLPELSTEEPGLACHPISLSLDEALDEAWFFGSPLITPPPSYAGSNASWQGS